MGMPMPFLYNAPKHPQYELEHNVTLNEHCTKPKSKKHLIYMFITEDTDTLYQENLRISDEIVFIANSMFVGFVTLTKVDDDTYVDYGFFVSLQKNFTENTFFGRFETN
ncbi:hypothetical protein BG006_011055 [Podila minutissima]|uniref:Uncharacterized protein n=1 Tax=Podila minutissima TaxID=64525 RepID=A0A9P5SQP6_9FUNG|nr:hypothetical protein BG006_011055 [Podila minutissima]